MRYIWQHIAAIIASFDGATPLPIFLKEYYKNNKKLGSRDRRILNEMVYSYYRCAKGLPAELPINEKVATCLVVCGIQNKHIEWLLSDVTTHEDAYNPNQNFPDEIDLSDGITKEEWIDSLLEQPDLFLRVRKDMDKLLSFFNKEGVEYEQLTDTCIALPNGTPIDKMLPEHMYVVQDASSQAVGDFLNPQPEEEWWDACSGAGGKSLLVKDIEPLVNLTVSDARRTILVNLKERFRKYSHILPTVHKVDVTNADKLKSKLEDSLFDHVLCDVPCTGSGTWARTPEQYYFFQQDTLEDFNKRQTNIAVNAAAYLKEGGKLYYITCSVFREENENVVAEITKQTGLQLEHQQIIKGIENRADNMFIAILTK
ncbi:MAG: hypothetical protein R2800_14090 [Flavipsychrobacter sp.]